MYKTPHYIALWVSQHVPVLGVFTRHIQQLDLIELCFWYREVLEKEPRIMAKVNELRMKWWANEPLPEPTQDDYWYLPIMPLRIK